MYFWSYREYLDAPVEERCRKNLSGFSEMKIIKGLDSIPYNGRLLEWKLKVKGNGLVII